MSHFPDIAQPAGHVSCRQKDLRQMAEALGPSGERWGGGKFADITWMVVSDSLRDWNSPTDKSYCGLIGYGPSRQFPGTKQWMAVAVYGPGHQPRRSQSVVYDGPSLEAACDLLSAKLNSKIKRGYQPEEMGTIHLHPGQVQQHLEDRTAGMDLSAAEVQADELSELLG